MSVQRSFALFLLGLATASAQQPVEAPPSVPVPAPAVPGRPPGQRPGVIPQLPPGVPGAEAQPLKEQAVVPGSTLGETKIIEDINEPKLSGNALAGLYRRYTGRRVIVSAAASAAEFSFVQEATPKDPLTFAQAAELLRKAATIENFIFIPDGEDPNLDFLTLPTGGIRPTQRGVGVYTKDGPVYSESDTLPEGDAVISYVMQLNYIKPVDAQNVFTQIIGQFGAYGSIAPVANASSLIITENTSLIRKLIDLKKEIDKPGSVQGTRFIKVQYADVTEIADTLTTLLTAQQTGQKTAGIQRADSSPVPGAPPVAGQAGGGGGAGEESPVQIVPDPRTNRIFAMGRPVDLLFVEGLVREFDVETSEKNFLRRKLRFLKVAEFLPVAGDALTRAFSGSGDGGGGGGASAQGGASRSPTSASSGSSRSQSSGRSSNSSSGANFGGSSSGGSSFGGSGSSSGGGGGGGGSSLSDPDSTSAPESVLVGRTLLVADNITNSIVVQGPPSGLEIIERLLDQIDVKPDQVMISTVIGQLSLADSAEFGVNYLLRGDGFRLGGGGGNGGLVIPGTTTGTGTDATTTSTGFPRFDPSTVSGSGLRAIGTFGDLQMYLRALQTKTDFTVLSRPSIFTSNNKKGMISSGEKIAIPTSNNNYNGGGSSTNIEYQDVVLKLEVIPLVNSNNEITMEIALLNDEQNGTQTIQGGGSDGGDLTVPKISTREILTTATVPNGNTIVLGGLIIGRKGTDRSGIPILSDIPYLGKLFSTTKNDDNRSELMVFIQPSVVNSDRSLNAVQADMDSRYKVSEQAHRVADGPGVLPDVSAIQPVSDKSGSATTTRTATPTQGASGASTVKPAIRPIFRR